MSDTFKKLCFGVKFDKQKFSKDIIKFEKKENKLPIKDTGKGKSGRNQNAPNKKLKEEQLEDEDDDVEEKNLDYIEFSDDEGEQPEEIEEIEEIEGNNPWGEDGDDDDGELGDIQEQEDGVEYDFSATDTPGDVLEGSVDEDEDDERLKYFQSSSTKRSQEPGSSKQTKQEMDHSQWERDEQARTGISAQEAADLREELQIRVQGSDVPFPLRSFDDLSTYKLSKALIKNLEKNKWTNFTPIQQQAIPALFCKREAVVCAPTGSGKTLCFALPILHLLKAPKTGGVRAVVLSPTRELAEQIYRQFKKLSAGLPFRFCLLTRPTFSNRTTIKPIYDIIITTPKRLVFLSNNKQVDLSKVEYLVFDEADKLFDEGFIEQVDAVVTACKNPKLNLGLFSATISPVVDELAKSVLRFPIDIYIGERNAAALTIEQKLVHVTEKSKLFTLRQIIKKGVQPPVMIFVKTRSRAKYLHKELSSDQLRVGASHSDLSPTERDEVVTKFRTGEIWFLIATDLMARGMDFKNVGCVINYDFPPSRSSYIHRIGRTGRAGKTGTAITFYSDKDTVLLKTIANVIRSSGGSAPEWMFSLDRRREYRKQMQADQNKKRPHTGGSGANKKQNQKQKSKKQKTTSNKAK